MAVQLPVQNYFSRITNPTPWTRQPDWPVITDAASEVQFLMSDMGNAGCMIYTQFTRTSGSQNIIIDWGDGTTNTITTNSGTYTSKTYIVGSGTPCSLGYTTFRVRVYFTGTGVSVMNQCTILAPSETGGVNMTRKTCDVLEVYYGDGTQTANPVNFNSSGQGISRYPNLQYVKLPATVTWTTMLDTFNQCNKLSIVVMPTSAASLNNLSSAFFNCTLLQSVTIPSNAINITGFSSTFGNCPNLITVAFPTTLNSCVTFNGAFTNCNALKNITLPSINVCTDMQSCFSACLSLEWVKFTSMPTFGIVTFVNLTSCFNNCLNLQTVYFPATCNTNANYNATTLFQSCTNLKQIVFPSGFNPNTCSGTFNTCGTLKRIVFQSAASRLNTMLSMCVNCRNLTDVRLPDSVSSTGINLGSAFQNCPSLETITIPSNYLFTSLFATFSNSTGLKTVNWSPGAQNSLTTMSGTFQSCNLLSSITLPTSMTTCNNMSGTFQGANALTSVTFPAIMNACTTLNSCFSNCRSLVSVTLPTSMSACNDFTSMFTVCPLLKSVVFPVTVSATTTAFQPFNDCMSLQSITFPTTQMSSVNTMFAAFANCTNITTLVNFDKLGSLTATPLVNMGANGFFSSNTISIACPLSALSLVGLATSNRNRLQVVRLLNISAGQWTGTSPQIDVSNTTMSTANIIQLFNDMAAQPNVVSKTINITGAVGAAGLTAANRLIVTSKGWTITG